MRLTKKQYIAISACLTAASVAVALLLINRLGVGQAQIPQDIAPADIAPSQEAAGPKPEPEPLYTDGLRPADRDIDFDALLEINEDVIAWISVPGTEIDYPVVWRGNNAYYLDRDIDGKYSMYGTIFMDMGNKAGFTDRNTVIYGHNMKDGTMFAQLHDFASPEFFEQNREIKLYTPEGMRVYEIFAAYTTDDRNVLYERDYSDDAVWEDYISEIYGHKVSGAIFLQNEMGKGDRILTLSTCVTGEDEQRYLVQGVLKRD